jgi:two-component system phosphate regulon sensor histidine kinase PhoR
MTGIKWTIETLLENEMGQLNEKQISIMRPVLEKINRLTGFINDMLAVSRIETGRKFSVNPEPTNVTPIIRKAADEMSDKAKGKGISINVDLPDTLGLMADKDKFKDLMIQIIDNAVKYSNPAGEVRIRADKDALLGMTIRVEDDGVGIPEREQENIFQRFFRSSNVKSETEGSGLGLYIAKVIVEKHEGKIWFKSEPGKGTAFSVWLKPAIAPGSEVMRTA